MHGGDLLAQFRLLAFAVVGGLRGFRRPGTASPWHFQSPRSMGHTTGGCGASASTYLRSVISAPGPPVPVSRISIIASSVMSPPGAATERDRTRDRPPG